MTFIHGGAGDAACVPVMYRFHRLHSKLNSVTPT